MAGWLRNSTVMRPVQSDNAGCDTERSNSVDQQVMGGKSTKASRLIDV